jgi:hypothetical protein
VQAAAAASALMGTGTAPVLALPTSAGAWTSCTTRWPPAAGSGCSMSSMM